ncbi:16667_t:CDS:2, partial [Acaulospora morrowiae]
MSKSARFPSVSRTVSVDRSKEIARETDYLDLDQLDLNRTYTLEEFEIISDQLKNRSLEIKVDSELVPISHFELDKSGKLVPMSPTPIFKEVAVVEIYAQIRNWNVQTGQNGAVTCSQGGFLIEMGEVQIPDVAFTPKEIYRNLTDEQGTSFRGPPFSPTFVVELGWLIDPINDEIWVYKRSPANGNVFRCHRDWGDLDGGDTLPGFKLDIRNVKEAISQEPSESDPSESEDENTQHSCPYCSQTFSNGYHLMKHMENDHLRKKRISR